MTKTTAETATELLAGLIALSAASAALQTENIEASAEEPNLPSALDSLHKLKVSKVLLSWFDIDRIQQS